MRWVIYNSTTGAIRAVLIGDQALAQANVREGEALVQHFGYVGAKTHEVLGGKVTPKG